MKMMDNWLVRPLEKGFGTIKIWLMVGILFLIIPVVPAQAAQSGNTSHPLGIHLAINGGINPAAEDYLTKGIQAAQKERADFVLLTIDTPGGLLKTTKMMVQNILNAPLPIITYVSPAGASATSAGVFITISGHVAAMAPGTSIGAAHPVSGSGKDIKEKGGKDMAQKVENYAAAFIEGIANKRGRNAQWAIQAVKQSKSITARKAVALNVVDLNAESIQELLQKIHGKKIEVNGSTETLRTQNARLKEREMTIVQKFLDFLSTPNVAMLLLSLGSLGIIAEIYSPGAFFPGVLGGIAFLLGLVSLQILPINYGGLALIILGMLLFVAELLVPSFGILGVGGIVSFIVGGLFLFDTPTSDLTVSWSILLAIGAGFGLFLVLAATLVGKVAFRRSRSGPESLVGETGEVVRDIAPGKPGKVLFHGEYWNAYAEHELKRGYEVEIVAVEGLKVKVQPVREQGRFSTNQE